jgi:CheY-like chemotaxis protein
MNPKICLLLTDDPDDQQSFSNALTEIDPNSILISVIDSAQAVRLLNTKKILPDLIFLDLSMYGMDVSQIANATRNDGDLRSVPLALYGYKEDSADLKEMSDFPYLDKDCTYSDLIKFVRTALK